MMEDVAVAERRDGVVQSVDRLFVDAVAIVTLTSHDDDADDAVYSVTFFPLC